MSSILKQHFTSMVNEFIPLGAPRRDGVDGTPHPVSGSLRLKPCEKTSKPLISLPKLTPPTKHPELEQRDKSTSAALKSSNKRPEQDSIPERKTVVRKLQPSNGNINPRKNGSVNPMVKKDILRRTSSYNRDREISYALSKELNENLRESSTTHHKTSPEGRVSLSAKRKRDGSMESEKEMKRPCADFQPTSSASIINSPTKFVKRIFVNSSNDSVITIKDKLSPKMLPAAPNSNNPRPLPSFSSQLFKPSEDSNMGSDRPHSFQPTKSPTSEPKDALVARANKNPKAPPSQPHLRKVSPKSSTTFDSIETHFTPDSCLPLPKTHNKKSNAETCTLTSPSSNHKESVKSRSSPHHPDLRSPSFAEQASSCKMEEDERTQLKVEQSRSPKAIMPDPAVSVKVEGSREQKYCPQWKDPLDIELGDDSGDELREHCNISLSSSSSGHEDEPLPSLEKLMSRRDHVPVTPEKDAFSEPNTPISKTVPEAVKTKAVSYKNTLEQMLQEKEQYQRSKELERQLLESCEEDLLNLDEDENSESKEEDISLEQREFLQRFSVASCAIRDIHPGEEVFMPARFGRLFNHQTLDLRKISVTPHNRSQQILFQARTELVLSLISAGLLRKAYFSFPCQPEVTRWLFQMMSVHPNPIISSHIMQSLQTIALSAAQHIVERQGQSFKVWVPSVRDITLVFLNMGASFISLFPLEALQPPFTEGDLLESFQPEEASQERVLSDMKDNANLPVHNLESVLKYLSLCTALCSRAYTDEELLLLLTVVCRIGLEIHFQLLPTGHFSLLLQNLLKNIAHWDEQISKTCQILTDLSEDHHNLRRLVYLLPDSSRGKQLKRHLSVSIISKLLNHTCTYIPSGTDFKLSELKRFLPQMRPSSLLKALRSAGRAEDCDATLDQQAYYLCYSLLTLTNEASNFEFLPSAQRVKDFVARIYTKWQVLLTRTRPQEGKLYDYWKPPPEDELPSSPQDQSCIKSQDTSESAEETQTADWSGAESDEDAESKEEEENSPKECEESQPLEGDVKIEQDDEDCVEDLSDAEEKNDEPKQQQMELEDDRKYEPISDEELFGSQEDLEREVKIEQSYENCVEDISDAEEKNDEPKQQMRELPDDRKFEPISDEELFENQEDSECEDENDLTERQEKLVDDRKFEPISDDELFESHEELECEDDDDLMNREEELLKDEEPHEENRKHIPEMLEELEDLLEKDKELLAMK
ncbi:SMC5-SMC6 complex localization factor 2-like protein [Labeo rohita]|uniref:SMC5-SMC6 complex localization factor 2-like protein n=1 Tax=Labeo rohita TaxID=84645 RepID=A0A498MZE3_LABRO|nr:SMC5-SMC6 complex localization factor 2-like protein [Labeo rohita]